MIKFLDFCDKNIKWDQKIDRFSIKNPLMNLLQSKTISGVFLLSFSSKIYINCTKKSLHSKIMSLDFDKSDKINEIFLNKNYPEFLYCSQTPFTSFLISSKIYSSVNERSSHWYFSISSWLIFSISESLILRRFVNVSTSSVRAALAFSENPSFYLNSFISFYNMKILPWDNFLAVDVVS